MNDLKEIGGFIVSADPYVNHDNSLSGNGTLTSPLGVVPGYNETVLWENTALPGSGLNGTVQLTEPVSAFNEIDAYYYQGPTSRRMYGIQRGYVTANSGNIVIGPWCENTTSGNWFRMSVSFNNNSATFVEFFTNKAGFNVTGDSQTASYHMWSQGNIWKIVGINRKQ